MLDPHLTKDAFITGLNILPGQPKVVHHVILFRVPPATVAAVEAKDRAEKGEGWTCFGGTGVETNEALDNAPWLGAWAPGGGEQVLAKDVGVPLAKGSRVIMQVHYNLLAGPRPDVSSAQLRLAPATKQLAPLRDHAAARAGRAAVPPGPRPAAALRPRRRRRGHAAAVRRATSGWPPTTCTSSAGRCSRARCRPATGRCRRRPRSGPPPATCTCSGRSIKIQVNPGTPRARTVLDIPVWDFDNQGAKPVKPVHLAPGDTVRVTCRHDQSLRDLLPAFKGQPEKYVVWGEGTTDEMCLGLLLVTRP